MVTVLKHILYALVWFLYLVFCFHWFPVYKTSIMIPSVLLVAIGGWLYGVRVSLLIVLCLEPYLYFLLDHNGDTLETYQTKAFGTGIGILVAIISGTTKRMRDQAKNFSTLLDQKANERTHELDVLTTRLISEDETLRINLAHNIHNGLGQYLTGVLLYSSSLETELHDNKSEEAARASALAESAKKNLHLARKASRILFPVRISVTGFEAALNELTSYFTETTGLKFDVQLDNFHQHLSDQTILHLYRITYEGILSALRYGTSSQINIALFGNHGSYLLRIESDETNLIKGNMESELMRYRAKQIKGHLTIHNFDNKTIIECQVPYNHAYRETASCA